MFEKHGLQEWQKYRPGMNQLKLTCAHINSLPWTKWPPFRRRHFQMHFHEWNVLHLDSNFTQICSLRANSQYASINPGNGLAPNRRQAITWTNANPVHWRIHATVGGAELNHMTHCAIFSFTKPSQHFTLTTSAYDSCTAEELYHISIVPHHNLSGADHRPFIRRVFVLWIALTGLTNTCWNNGSTWRNRW